MPGTLIFCTSYAPNAETWDDRIRLWIDSLISSSLHFDQLLIVDDGSSSLPFWEDTTIVQIAESQVIPRNLSKIAIVSFSERLGRSSIFDFPGWFRSYTYGIKFGCAAGFSKILHVESDAHIVSRNLCTFLNDFSDGWISMWSKKYSMPEIAIQAAAGAGLEKMRSFAEMPYSYLRGQVHEKLIPFTSIESSFVGDRYGEDFFVVPRNADFSTQTHVRMQKEYYWWIRQSKRFFIELYAPFPENILTDGWSYAEGNFQWMIDEASSIKLLASPPSDLPLQLWMRMLPCTPQSQAFQRILIYLNEIILTEIVLTKKEFIKLDLVPGSFSSKAANILTVRHPDAISPFDAGFSLDNRKLAAACYYIALVER